MIEEQSVITNLPWVISGREIRRTFDLDVVHLLNDLEAIASSVPHLEPSDLFTLNEGESEAEGAIAVIAPGTGLGEAFLTWDGQRYRAHPSEGGHASFAPNTPQQRELLAYLQGRFRHVSCERVCSGSGIPNIYDFLRDSGRFDEPAWLREELSAAEDVTPIISAAADAGRAEIAMATMDLFVEILAGEAGNMALKVLATGGVFLGGGIPPKILPRLQATSFMDTFDNKGRFSELMASLPVRVILNPRAALYGAAHYALDESRYGQP